MKIILTTSIFWCLTFVALSAFSQIDFRKSNQQKLDSIKLLFGPCKILSSSKKLKKREINYDKKLLSLCNDFYSKDLTINETVNQIANVTKRGYHLDSTNLGGTTLYQARLAAKGNLRLTISFATFLTKLVYKQIAFSTASKTGCSDPATYLIAPNDLDYLGTICIPNLTIPLHMCWNCVSVTSDTTFYDVLKNYNGNDYVLFTSDTANLLNYFTWHDISIYMKDYVVEGIRPIIKQKNIPLLMQLLYSPNHILAIYAMEALTFFESENQILPDQIRNKMMEISNSNILIYFQYSDVVRQGFAYKDLHISKQQLVDKYNRP